MGAGALGRWAKLEVQGCKCGSDRPATCKLHSKPGDNRGLRAFFEAGMPNGFPFESRCSICRTDGLMYPNVELDDPDTEVRDRPTLICPNCSVPAAEAALVREVEVTGNYTLNGSRVFAQLEAAS